MISSSSPAPVASSAAIWSASCRSAATAGSARVDVKPLAEWYQKTPGRREPGGRPRPARALPGRRQGRPDDLQPRRRHGRHGLHRDPQGRVHAVGAGQHPHAGGRQGSRHRALLLFVVGLRLQRRQADPRRRHRAQGRGRLSRRCRRTATAGRSCSASAWRATTARTTASPPGSRATTTSTARKAPTTAAARRRRPRSAAR